MQVPDQFVPSATTSPLGISPVSGTAVEPMRNAAPGQMQQSGADTQQLGEVTNDIGERIQNQLDNAMAKQADTKFSQAMDAITLGDGTDANPGFLHRLGQDAIDAFPAAAAAAAKAKNSIADGLSDDFQRSMFNRVATQRLVDAGNRMNDHLFVQKKQFAGESAVDRAQAFVPSMAANWSAYGQVDANTGAASGEFNKSLQAGEKETLEAVAIQKGAPPGTADANKALLDYHSQIGLAVVKAMVDAPQDSRPSPSRVQGVLDGMNAKGWLDSHAQEAAVAMVKTYSDGEVTWTVGNQTLADAQRAASGQPTSADRPDIHNPVKGSTITAQPFDPEKGGVELTIPQNSAVQAPADGTVTGLGKNEDGIPYLQLTHKDGSVSTLTGLNAYSVKVGDQVKGGENIATSGVSDSPRTPSVLWSLADKNGNAIDPTKAGLAPVDLHAITDEKVLDSALSAMREQIPDEKLQDHAASEMNTLVKGNQQQANALQTQLFKQASDLYAPTKNWRSIPTSLFSQLSPERQQQFKDDTTANVLKNYEQGQRFKEMGETDLVHGFLADRQTLTQANVDAARPNLADSTYQRLTEMATTQANNPKGVIEAQAVSERIKALAEGNGMNVSGTRMNPDGSVVSVKQTAADKHAYSDLTFKVQNDIDQIKAQNHGKATAKQVDDAITAELTQRTLAIPRSPNSPLNWLPFAGTRSYPAQKPAYAIPAGATSVYYGNDGLSHYTDGKNDLGVVK